jgi:ATP adenylyltransferase/5',5'''-P-1,P-4-tetraphosphate phosphorylase II
MGHIIITDEELKQYGPLNSKADKLRALYNQQRESWPALKKGALDLDQIKKRTVTLDNQELIIQFNPARMASVSAKVDSSSIKARPCFLCAQNLPSEQRGIIVGSSTVALANPMPIFPMHFTLTHPEHCLQDISGRFEEFLAISKELSDEHVVFFNGALAGASAPDHHHLQSCPIDSFPLVKNLRSSASSRKELATQGSVKIETVKFCNNNYILLASKSASELTQLLEKSIASLTNHHKNGKEMLNILSYYEADEGWSVILIPREKHRPSCFFEEDPKKLLISPATVEMSGIIVTARESDFERITSKDIEVIFNEVMLNTTSLNKFTQSLIETK